MKKQGCEYVEIDGIKVHVSKRGDKPLSEKSIEQIKTFMDDIKNGKLGKKSLDF